MPFDQKYDAATREAATARVLERQATNPKDRHVFTVVANEFNVGQQSLRAWVAAAAPDAEKPAKQTRRPRFSPVVTRKIEQDPEEPEPQAPVTAAQTPPSPAPLRTDLVRVIDTTSDTTALEAEVAALRQGNEALKAAMRILLEG